MNYKVKITQLGQIWGDVEWRIVNEDGRVKILSDAEGGKWGKPERWVRGDRLEEYEVDIIPLETRNVLENEIQYSEYLLPSDYTIEILDITEQFEKDKLIEQMIAKGKNLKACCEDVLAFITGYNEARELTSENVTAMQITFSNIFSMLISNRANTAKILINLVEVDETIVTQDMKDNCLSIFSKYNI